MGGSFALVWHFRNEELIFSADKFRPKCSSNLRYKDAFIETYLSCWKEKLLDIEIPFKIYTNLTKD